MLGLYKFLQAVRTGAALGFLADIDHPDGDVHFWTGLGTVQANGHTYTGTGLLHEIKVAKKSTALRVDEVELSLRGIDNEVLTQIGWDVRGREGDLWLAAFRAGRIFGDPQPIDNMICDFLRSITDESSDTKLILQAQSGFWRLQMPAKLQWSDSYQQSRFPGDIGMNQISDQQIVKNNWTVS